MQNEGIGIEAVSAEERTTTETVSGGGSSAGALQGDGGISNVGEDEEVYNSKGFETPISEDDQIKLADEGVQEGINIGFFSINGYRIRKECPKVFKDLFSWINDRSQVGDLDENFLIGSLAYSPRTILPEFFDKHKIFINFHYIEIGPTNWKYTITEPGIGVAASTELYSSRVNAEVAAYYTAFKKLENTLT